MTPTPTGRREERDATPHLVLTRTFGAPIAAVWRAVTEPARLERWIGTWSGDPAAGSVVFQMTAEGEDVAAETYTIVECVPPRRLVTSSVAADSRQVWWLTLDLVEQDGQTTLTFAQRLDDPGSAADIGPGWEYYLDRLVAAESDAEVAAVDFQQYYPAMSSYYRSLFTG